MWYVPLGLIPDRAPTFSMETLVSLVITPLNPTTTTTEQGWHRYRPTSSRVQTNDNIANTVKFIINYNQVDGLLLPGLVLGFKEEDVKLLPSSETMAKVHKGFVEAMQSSGMHIT